jgi:hypothetical protein
MAWQTDTTSTFDDWFASLREDEQDAILAAIEKIEERGPGLGRPLVDTIKKSRHQNMKELRPPIGNIRILFAFDRMRSAILLVGGDKTNLWKKWYDAMIPIADQLFDDHLAHQEGGKR